MEVSVCTNVVVAKVQDFVVIVLVIECVVVVWVGDVTTVREVDVALVVTVEEDVAVVVDQVFNRT
ncbi:hypothetical protein J7E79_29485 [Bacillus sp. ISL-40]|uniref:hypothetical protein n=1 Tax=unclassified Bacillus (in: firmicutes) TaxID=185979 RepID=UPI001BE8B928|nr:MULTISPECIES: hypothetical protein [unclassified Bacillus (in: firmicutes)]MBT2701392.1 hypothetical protein [Bacillus sp. ISL-40]MBT2743645.1 hypothetical protein [Bacillus sp. ISL-77]